MNRFLIRLALLTMPVLVGVLCSEWFLQTRKTAFQRKADYFNKHREIEAIILGSSHAMNGINPRFLSIKSANLAHGSQDLQLDLELLKESIANCPQLKTVVIELSYHRLLRKNPDRYWRNALYQKYYSLDGLSGTNLLSRHLLSSTNLKFFRNYIVESLKRETRDENFNAWGFNEADFNGVFKNLQYDTVKIIASAPKRLKQTLITESSQDIVNMNQKTLEIMLELCNKNHIRVVLVALPVYDTYQKGMRRDLMAYRTQWIESITRSDSTVSWFNFEALEYPVRYFINDDHLNSRGAELFTQKLNQLMFDTTGKKED